MKNNDWLGADILEAYLDGSLDAKTMHQVERISLEDPFVAQAMAGLSESKRRAISLSILQKQLQERLAQKPVEQKRWNMTGQRLSIAATAAVLFLTATILFWMRTSKNEEAQLAAQQNVSGVTVELKDDTNTNVAEAATAIPKPAETVVAAVPVETAASAKAAAAVEAPAPAKTEAFIQTLDKVKPEPAEGWLKYDEYLEKNNQFLGDGEKMVELGFSVQSDGSVTDILVLQGQSERLNKEAVRLLSLGPKWKYKANAANKGTIIIKF